MQRYRDGGRQTHVTQGSGSTKSERRYCCIKKNVNYADDRYEHHEHQLEDAKGVEGCQDDHDGGQEQERGSRHLVVELSNKEYSQIEHHITA